MAKRTVIVTGATSGLGLETAKNLAQQGHVVIVASRRREMVESTCSALKAETKNDNVHGMVLDLGSLAAVKQSAEELLQRTGVEFDTLVLNAAVSNTNLQTTPDGLEAVFATNHMGHYYLVKLLHHRLISNARAHGVRARIVVVSSGVHDPANHNPLPAPTFDLEQWRMPKEGTYSLAYAYPQSKLANAIFANDLAAQHDPQVLTVATYDPGFIGTTGLNRTLPSPLRAVLNFISLILLSIIPLIYHSTSQIGSIERSPAFLARLAVDEVLISETGRYYCVDKLDKCSADASNSQYQIQLRAFSDALLNEKGFDLNVD